MAINEKRISLYIRNFEKALNGYAYNEPLSRYLTRFFKENKQMGSSDRKMTSRFMYNYFRLGNSLKDVSPLHRLCYAEFLCEDHSDLVAIYFPNLFKNITYALEAKIRLLQDQVSFNLNDVFPFVEELSSTIDKEKFIFSHFIQPDVFIRLKRGEEHTVVEAFEEKGINYTAVNSTALALPNGTRLQDFQKIEGKFEVQDLSSQKTIAFMDANRGESWWDACAASGGKSLLFLDKFPGIKLLTSDIRLSILRNLNARFDKSRVKAPARQKVIDLTADTSKILGNEQFDGIILDVPCSGSGTWSRTPEMIQQFSKEKLNDFSTLQKKIASNVIKHLKIGKPLVYMTCSVYTEENEKVIEFLVKNFNLQIEKMELIKGYEEKADSMFAARLIRKD